jgi:hypothetical protein
MAGLAVQLEFKSDAPRCDESIAQENALEASAGAP